MREIKEPAHKASFYKGSPSKATSRSTEKATPKKYQKLTPTSNKGRARRKSINPLKDLADRIKVGLD